ncbi:iron ABC transporter ATP-binding protein [Marinococcus halophilus]|uniref:Putative ABC transporter ATP-binding protein YclP n=1 Tax=Marinococcus halophilus TaxID=1371 RepID=A0A510YBS7_MARHA|nr:ABC transporter ATP-binding protein [Marinococcus halophilus]OZT78914.1 iron ABC transporter ATP-binding protein [Marinococcus halophilus]GEK60081.1 putative ABC transporter ATP-binding protein YclP [Marinococcus halophilus]
MVQVMNVTKKYDETPVVNDVSVTIKQGQITSFIGPNGAGKSTLLSMISRLIAKDAGEVRIGDKDITKTKSRELAKKLAILKQSNEMNARLTVRELISFGRFPYSQGRLNAEDWEHVDQAIDYMELWSMQDSYIHQLSGGQRQRAFIAMVIAQDTDYILLDEPLNNLDMKHSVQIMKVLRRLVKDMGKTVLLVIHDINFASCYSDDIVALKNGHIVAQGTTEEMMASEVLTDIYEMDMPICRINDQKICVYFT